jgi:hypothetical protein
MRPDFYYSLGALVNFYGHYPSTFGMMRESAVYNMSKPFMWSTNAVRVSDWWKLRSAMAVIPSHDTDNHTASVHVVVSGSQDPDAAIELVIPNWNESKKSTVQVWLNGAPASGNSYRFTSYGVKVRVGSNVANVDVLYDNGA